MVDVNFPRYNTISFSAATVEELRDYPVTDVEDGMLAFVAGQVTLDDGVGGVYFWSPASVEADDDLDVVAPTGVTTGRWLRILSNRSAVFGEAGLATAIGSQTFAAAVDRITTSGYATVGLGSATYSADAQADAALAAMHPRFCKADATGRYFRLIPTDGFVCAEQGGLVPYATKALAEAAGDQRAALQATIEYASVFGYRVRFASAGGFARCHNMPTSEVNFGVGGQPSLILRERTPEVDGGGLTLVLPEAGSGIRGGAFFTANEPWFTNITPIIQTDLAVGDTEVEVDDTTGIEVGMMAFLQSGQFAFDKPEPEEWFHFRVKSIVGNVIEMDRPVTESLVIASLDGSNIYYPTSGKQLGIWPTVPENFAIHDINFDLVTGGTYYNAGVHLQNTINPRIWNITTRKGGYGCVVLQYASNFWVGNCMAEDHVVDPSAAFSRGFSVAESFGTFDNCGTRGCAILGHAEGNGHVAFNSPWFANTAIDDDTGLPRTDVVVFRVAGKSTMTVRDPYIEGYGGLQLTDWQSHTGEAYRASVVIEGTTRIRTLTPPANLRVHSIRGILDMTHTDGTREVYDFGRPELWETQFDIANGMNLTAYGPSGIAFDVDVYTTADLAGKMPASLTGVYFGDSTTASGNAVTAVSGFNYGPLQGNEGKVVRLQHLSGYAPLWEGRNLRKRITITTASGTDLDTLGSKVAIRAKIAPPMQFDQLSQVRDAWSEADWLRRSGMGGRTYEARFTGTDLPNIVTLTTHTLNVAIADMAVGDIIEGAVLSIALGGLEITGYEAKAGSADIFIRNNTVADINLASGTLTVKWSKKGLGA